MCGDHSYSPVRPVSTGTGKHFAEAQLTDRLSLTNALADANIDRKAAERIATEIFDAIHENVATKADIAAIKAELRELELRLDARIDRVVVRLARWSWR